MGMSSGSTFQTGTGAAAMGQAGNFLGVGGALSSTIGAFYASQAQKDSLDFQAEVADSNARIAEKAAQSALLQGQQRANATQLRTAQLEGTQRTDFAANGVDLGEGSAARVLASTEMMGKTDADTEMANAVRSAWGLRTQGVNYQNQALMDRASSEAISPYGAAASSLLSGASNVASNWYKQKKAGV